MAKEDITKIYRELGVSRHYITDLIGSYEDSVLGGVSRDYSRDIAWVISDDVARDLHANYGPEDWDINDVRLAVGRVLCEKLKVIQ